MARKLLDDTLPDVIVTQDDVTALLANAAFLHICQVAAEREMKYLDIISAPELPSDQRAYWAGRRAGLMEFIEAYLSVISGKATLESSSLDKTQRDVVDSSVETVRAYVIALGGLSCGEEPNVE